MPAVFSPEYVVQLTETLGPSGIANISLPPGVKLRLSSVTATGSNAASQFGVTNGVNNALSSTVVGADQKTFAATDSTLVLSGSVFVINSGSVGNISNVVLRFFAASPRSLTVQTT
jgi:hypothetical protein